MTRPYALTFDDGPGDGTHAVLDLLGQYGQLATFFVLGERAQHHKDTLQRIVREGHQLAYHGWTHEPSMGFEATQKQLKSAIPYLELMSQRLYRPPWGQISVWGVLACRIYGWKLANWSVTVADWVPRSPEAMLDSLLTSIHPRAVVLLHDHHEGGSTFHSTPRSNMLEMLERFFNLTRGNLQSVRWDEL